MAKLVRFVLVLALGPVAVVLPGCGAGVVPIVGVGLGDERSIITEGSQSNIPPFQTSGGAGYFVVVKTLISGTLEGSVDWTFASNEVHIFWGRGDCTLNPSCELIAQNTGSSKPKMVSAVNASPGTYSLIVLNRGTTNESISYRVALIP